jgi:hypothetical protein
MAIGNKQIGWSQESNLLWDISKQLDRAIAVLCTGPCPPTTTTTTTLNVICKVFVITNAFGRFSITFTNCEGVQQGQFFDNPTGEPISLCAISIDNGPSGMIVTDTLLKC